MTVIKLNSSRSPSPCTFTHLSCMCVWERVELTVMHEAIVAQPYAQHHGVLSGRTVSLGNQVNDAHSWSDTMPVYTFSYKAHCSTAGLRLSVCLLERRWWSVSQHVILNMRMIDNEKLSLTVMLIVTERWQLQNNKPLGSVCSFELSE